MARLIEPDGTPGLVVTVAYAVEYCRTHPDWTWQTWD